MELLILLSIACAPSAPSPELELRLQALEQARAAQEIRIHGMETRLQAVEGQQPLPTPDAPPPQAPQAIAPSTVKVGPDGVLVTDLSTADRLQCVYRSIEGLVTAEVAYDAAFDEFSDDPSILGWQPVAPCDEQVTLNVEFLDDHEIRVNALLLRGKDRGRFFTYGLGPRERGPTREEHRLGEAELQRYLKNPKRMGLRSDP